MENEKRFKTKTGFCHILPNQIVLTRDGVIGNASKILVGNGIYKLLLVYSAISIILFYSAYTSYLNGAIVSTFLLIALGLFLMYGVISSINNSATPIIDRDKIKSITFKKAIVGLTRSRFEVLFEDENLKIKKRIIMLPGSLTGGQNETEIALKIMVNEKLISIDSL